MMQHGMKALGALVLMTAFSSGLMSAESLVLSVRTTQARVKRGDEVPLQLLLESVAQAPVWIPGRLIVGGDLWVEVKDATGRRLPYLGEKYTLKPLGKDDFLKLNPHHVYGRHVNLATLYDLNEPGKYLVQASLSNKDAGQRWGHHAWTGSLTSNEIEIVIEP